MKRMHRMPFGAERIGDAGVRFRLWAPTASGVDLCLDGAAAPIEMQAAAGGWFERTMPGACAGARYRYRIDGSLEVPDPASRSNPQDVHGTSEVIDPGDYDWRDADWRGRPWHEAVLYELHVGAFTPEGTFSAAAGRLPYLRDLGVTAVELMPVADFPGRRNWGYDGVLLFAPDSAYGRPDDLKRLVDAAHALGLMVFLDVVYNHFGPDGNYLHAYARDFFTERHHTPWGAAINYDGTGSRVVRDFFIHNALYWLEEFHFDGLRLDAVHAIIDDTSPDILCELADAVRAGPGRSRAVHLVLENDDNRARYLGRRNGNPRWYDAQWNDDAHHALHVLLTGERDGYYADYADERAKRLGRSLAEGFVYQGDFSAHRGRSRGEVSRALPATSFVAFLQNHDQVGNRALGERLTLLASPQAQRAGLALLLLAPWIPLMFMGDEFGCEQPFPFFCDFSGDLARAVREGRRSEFAAFAQFQNPASRECIPDPNAEATFDMARIDWAKAGSGEHAMLRDWVCEVLRVRALRIVPLLPNLIAGSGAFDVLGEAAVSVRWKMRDGGLLSLAANLGDAPVRRDDVGIGEAIYAWPADAWRSAHAGTLPAWSVFCAVQKGGAR